MNRISQALLCVVVLCALASASSDNVTVTPTAADYDAARAAKITRHAMPANTDRGNSMRHSLAPKGLAKPSKGSPADARIRYPGDLTFNGGAVLDTVVSHSAFVNPTALCPAPQCWGDPITFLKDLGNSKFIRVVDQYVGLKSDDRYTSGANFVVTFSPPATPLTDNDMAAIAHAVSAFGGFSGYGNIVHIFLKPGQDVCFDSSFSVCYSPDNPASFVFCAYHSSADFLDIGHVLYSVEPYQNVGGCQVRPGTPNGTLIDSTNNVLSHELIEAITDPDGTAWFNTENLDNLFAEIADECSFVSLSAGAFDPSNVKLDKHQYAIQPEYSNDDHACITGP